MEPSIDADGETDPAMNTDATAPTLAVSPEAGALLETNTAIVLTFSEPIASDTLVLGGGLGAAASVSWFGNVATLSGPWPEGAAQTLTVVAADAVGNSLAPVSLLYDVSDAPTATQTPPTTIGARTPLRISFSHAMDPGSLVLSGPMAAQAMVEWIDADTVELRPGSAWTDGEGTLEVAAANLLGRPLAALVLSFSIDATLPTVVSVTPNDATTIGPLTPIVIVFSEPVDGESFAGFSGGAANAIGSTELTSGNTMTVTPGMGWAHGASQELVLGRIADLVGNEMAEQVITLNVDAEPPTLIDTAPSTGLLTPTMAITLTASEPLAGTQSASGSMVALDGVSQMISGSDVTLTPVSAWNLDAVELGVQLRDIYGNTSVAFVQPWSVIDAVHVCTGADANAPGDDAQPGTKAEPKASLAAAFVHAASLSLSKVRMCTGDWVENASVPAGMHIEGSFDSATWLAPASVPSVWTRISASGESATFPRTTLQLATQTTLEGLEVIAGTNGDFTATSCAAVYLPSTADVQILRTRIVAGDACAAAYGLYGAQSGATTLTATSSTFLAPANASGGGRAIYLTFSAAASLAFTQNRIESLDTAAAADISIYASATGTMTFRDNVILATGPSFSSDPSFALWLRNPAGQPTTVEALLEDNRARGGAGERTGGLVVANVASCTVSRNVVVVSQGATGYSQGPGISCDASVSARIDHNLVNIGGPNLTSDLAGITTFGPALVVNNTISMGQVRGGYGIQTSGDGARIINNLVFAVAIANPHEVQAFGETLSGGLPAELINNAVFLPAVAGYFTYRNYTGGGGNCPSHSFFACYDTIGALNATATSGALVAADNVGDDPLLVAVGDAQLFDTLTGDVIVDWALGDASLLRAAGLSTVTEVTTDFALADHTPPWSIGAYENETP